jgi:Cu+-exporting ATPase
VEYWPTKVTPETLAEAVEQIGFDAKVKPYAEASLTCTQLRLSVQGMTCSACSSAVEGALRRVPGVKVSMRLGSAECGCG